MSEEAISESDLEPSLNSEPEEDQEEMGEEADGENDADADDDDDEDGDDEDEDDDDDDDDDARSPEHSVLSALPNPSAQGMQLCIPHRDGPYPTRTHPHTLSSGFVSKLHIKINFKLGSNIINNNNNWSNVNIRICSGLNFSSFE